MEPRSRRSPLPLLAPRPQAPLLSFLQRTQPPLPRPRAPTIRLPRPRAGALGSPPPAGRTSPPSVRLTSRSPAAGPAAPPRRTMTPSASRNRAPPSPVPVLPLQPPPTSFASSAAPEHRLEPRLPSDLLTARGCCLPVVFLCSPAATSPEYVVRVAASLHLRHDLVPSTTPAPLPPRHVPGAMAPACPLLRATGRCASPASRVDRAQCQRGQPPKAQASRPAASKFQRSLPGLLLTDWA
ncbi:vegetative cell wall protein gp1-like [Triticum aestivum]|uniref:vegetative cell wall protein gp1-like n=1 Tax=Triticum aestivum TaxID=4565 RepID=UPI001D011863|nr:vegetative cell wall protein gp1-like [Triticum aestivum]